MNTNGIAGRFPQQSVMDLKLGAFTNVHHQCFDANVSLDKVKSCITARHKVLVIMRGVPGSGKTSLAK
jgi:hypothetical protein